MVVPTWPAQPDADQRAAIGTLLAALLLGVAESLTSTFVGPSWSPAVAFGLLLLTLGLRPSGLLGRR